MIFWNYSGIVGRELSRIMCVYNEKYFTYCVEKIKDVAKMWGRK